MLPQTLETDINNRQAITELLQSNGFKVIHVISTGSDTLDLFFRNTLEAPVGMSMDQNSPESHREARTHFVSESSKSLERVRKEIADAGIDVPRNQGDRKLRRSLR